MLPTEAETFQAKPPTADLSRGLEQLLAVFLLEDLRAWNTAHARARITGCDQGQGQTNCTKLSNINEDQRRLYPPQPSTSTWKGRGWGSLFRRLAQDDGGPKKMRSPDAAGIPRSRLTSKTP